MGRPVIFAHGAPSAVKLQRFASGAICTKFILSCKEGTFAGSQVPCEVWGKAAEQLSEGAQSGFLKEVAVKGELVLGRIVLVKEWGPLEG